MTASVGRGPHNDIAIVDDDWTYNGVKILLGRQDPAGSSFRGDGGTGNTVRIEQGDHTTEPPVFARIRTDEAFALHLALAEHFNREAVGDVGFVREELRLEHGRVDKLIDALIGRPRCIHVPPHTEACM